MRRFLAVLLVLMSIALAQTPASASSVCKIPKGGDADNNGSGDRVFKRSFLTYLRRQLNSDQRKIMKNCQLINSKNNVLIQMADMVAGAVKRSYEVSLNDSKIYKSIIERHIEDEWKFR